MVRSFLAFNISLGKNMLSRLSAILIPLLLAVVPVASHAQDRQTARDSATRVLPVDGIAAIVGEKVVLISDVLSRVHFARAAGREPADARELAVMQREAIDSLIEEELLVQRAQAESIMVNEADLLRSMDDFEQRTRSRFRNDGEFRTALRQTGFQTLEEWRRMQMDQMRRGMMQRDLFVKLRREQKIATVNASEKEISEVFDMYKDQLPPKPAMIGMRQIVIPTSGSEAAKKRARTLADSLRAELVTNPDRFEEIARRESMDLANRDQGGDLGWNRRGLMVPEFDRMMFALNPGVISPVVETTFGFHIIRVDRVQPAEVKARHILIRATLDSADVKRASELAKEVVAAWRNGANYDSLASKHHDAVNEEKSIPEFVIDSLPESYRLAVQGRAAGDIIDPFEIEDPSTGASKFVIVQVSLLDEGGQYTLDEYRDRIRAQLSEEHTIRRFIDSLRKGTFVQVVYDPIAAVGSM